MTAHQQPHQPYRRVMTALLADIESGRLGPGDQLPSTRELAEQYGVASMTVRNALKHLQQQGHVQPTHGVGWFVTEPPPSGQDLEDRVATLEREVQELRTRIES
ncbi:GntR family transcriptional regulator [Halostreptopolyspora alba]